MPQSIIYSFEHRYIPSSVFKSQYFLDDLFKYGERKVLYTAIQDIYNKPVQDAPICPYKPEDFGGFHGQLSETLYFSLLVFPAPREAHRNAVFGIDRSLHSDSEAQDVLPVGKIENRTSQIGDRCHQLFPIGMLCLTADTLHDLPAQIHHHSSES